MRRLSEFLRKLAQAAHADMPQGFLGRLTWQYAGTIATVAAGFAYSIVLARYLGVTLYGTMALVIAAATVLSQFFQADMRDFLIWEMTAAMELEQPARAANALAKAIAINLFLSITFCFVVWLFAGLLGSIWSSQDKVAIFLPLAAINVAAQLMLTDGLYGALRVFEKVSQIAVIQIIIATARLAVVGISLSLFNIGLGTILLLSGACYLLGALVIGFIVVKHTHTELKAPITLMGVRWWQFPPNQRKYILHNYLTYLYALPGRDLDINLLAIFAPLEAVGVYRMAKNFVGLLWTATDPIHLVLYPEYARLWSQQAWQNLSTFTRRLIVLLAMAAIALFAISCAIVPPVIVFFAGRQFAPSGMLFIFMATSILFWLPQKWLPPLLLAAGRADINMKAAFGSGLLGIGIYWFLGHRYGTVGIAWSYSINLTLLVLMQFAWAWRAGIAQRALKRPAPAGRLF